ncbi:12954_t:CDS:1, partial [Acaulospora morrowiae]
ISLEIALKKSSVEPCGRSVSTFVDENRAQILFLDALYYNPDRLSK